MLKHSLVYYIVICMLFFCLFDCWFLGCFLVCFLSTNSLFFSIHLLPSRTDNFWLLSYMFVLFFFLRSFSAPYAVFFLFSFLSALFLDSFRRLYIDVCLGFFHILFCVFCFLCSFLCFFFCRFLCCFLWSFLFSFLCWILWSCLWFFLCSFRDFFICCFLWFFLC